MSASGGHLASNLGVVELTLALYSMYDLPEDVIIWDVGHQSYAHKLLTGRFERFGTLRQYEGISGFPKMEESQYDRFGTGHSSTSISAALGFAKARDLRGSNERVVAVIGDGALTGGLAWEALNNASHLRTDLTVILNDNEMSISRNVGALATHLSKLRLRPIYRKFESRTKLLLQKLPTGGEALTRTAEGILHGVTHLIAAQAGIIFEEMGFKYFGPIDGHDIELMREIFDDVKDMEGPVLVHVLTTKGKGYEHAENRPSAFHGTPPFVIENGEVEKTGLPTFTAAFSDALVELAEADERIVAITAAMPDGAGVNRFAERFPQRFFDVGIAEGHAVTFASGLAAAGLRPVVAIYSTFLQRAYDQLVHDVCLQNLPVVFAVGNAGLVGEDGPTHHGAFDISYLRQMPNMVVAAPADAHELREMLKLALTHKGPFAIRYPRGACEPAGLDGITPLAVGKAAVLADGDDICIISIGCTLAAARKACDSLREQGVSAGLINARFAKPLDSEAILNAAKRTGRLVIVEENAISGGFGSSIAELLAQCGVEARVRMLGLPDRFVPHGSNAILRESCGLDSRHITEAALELLAAKVEPKPDHKLRISP